MYGMYKEILNWTRLSFTFCLFLYLASETMISSSPSLHQTIRPLVTIVNWQLTHTFNTAAFMCLSQHMTLISNVTCSGLSAGSMNLNFLFISSVHTNRLLDLNLIKISRLLLFVCCCCCFYYFFFWLLVFIWQSTNIKRHLEQDHVIHFQPSNHMQDRKTY